MTSAEDGARADGAQHATRTVLILGALSCIAPFATDMYLSSMPTLVRVFHTDLGRVQATLSAFLGGVAVGQLIWGPLADRFGRRTPLLWGMALYLATAFLVLVAPNIETVIGLRFLQAFGSCAGMVIGRAVIRDLFEGRSLASALSVMMIIQSIGPILAPILGGYIFTLTGWTGNFWFLGLFGVACFASLLLALPETLDPKDRREAHPVAVFKTFGGLLREPGFLLPALCGSAAISALFTYISNSSGMFMEQHGASPQLYVWLLAINSGASVLAAQLNRLLLKRATPASVLMWSVVGNAAASGAVLLLAQTPSLLVLMIPLWFLVGSFPLIAANSSALAMGPTTGRAGSASSLLGVMQWGCASVVSTLSGLSHNGAIRPVAMVLFACGLVAVITFWLGPRKLLGQAG